MNCLKSVRWHFLPSRRDESLRPKPNHFIDRVLSFHPWSFFLLQYLFLSLCYWWEQPYSAGLHVLVITALRGEDHLQEGKRSGWRDRMDSRLSFRSQHCTSTISPLKIAFVPVNFIIITSYYYWPRMYHFSVTVLSAVLRCLYFCLGCIRLGWDGCYHL